MICPREASFLYLYIYNMYSAKTFFSLYALFAERGPIKRITHPFLFHVILLLCSAPPSFFYFKV